MKVQTIRWIDRWLGIPVCIALTGIRRLMAMLTTETEQRVRSIVFIKLAEQGSTVLAQSAIHRAIELVGRDNVYFLVFEENRFILDAMCLIPPQNVICISQRNLLATACDGLRTLIGLRKLGVSAAIDLEFFARCSAAMSYLCGAKYRIGFHAAAGEGPYRGNLMTHRLRYNPYLHTAQMFLTMVEAATFLPGRLQPVEYMPPPLEDRSLRIEPTPKEVEEVRTILCAASARGHFQPLILLNANCSDMLPLRRWPGERYVDIARRLLQRYSELHVGFTGAPAERAAVAELVQQVGSDRCFSLAGWTSLRQLLVVYGLAEVLVTNDSGPAHFSALTPIDVVTLFGPETPRLFATLGPRSHVFWEALACSPCVSALNNRESKCEDNICMRRIDADRVFAAICRIYDTRMDKNKQLTNHCIARTPTDNPAAL